MCTTTGTNTYGTSAGGFVDGDGGAEIWATSPGGAPALAPTMYYRLLYSGGAFETIGGISTGGFYLDEGVLNTWTVNSLFRVMMRGYDDLTPGVVRYEKSGTLTIEAATDALGANIVSTLSVDFRIALQVTN